MKEPDSWLLEGPDETDRSTTTDCPELLGTRATTRQMCVATWCGGAAGSVILKVTFLGSEVNSSTLRDRGYETRNLLADFFESRGKTGI